MARRRSRGYGGFRPYVPVSRRHAKAAKLAAAAKKRGDPFQPVQSSGRNIAATFWGRAWCQTLESYGDYANRLPRGRTYIRNGSVIDLRLEKGAAAAVVMGSDRYDVEVTIDALSNKRWRTIRSACAGRIESLVALLEGDLSDAVMEVLTGEDTGIFPAPAEIHVHCSCPDWAMLCKHVAATLYGIGVRFDDDPALFFMLRGVDHRDLVTAAAAAQSLGAGEHDGEAAIADEDLGTVFGFELDDSPTPSTPATFTARELIDLGVPRSTISSWLRRGALARTKSRGVYGVTATTGDTLEAYFERDT